MNTKKIQKFTENASPDNWLQYANELKRTAFILWNDGANSIIIDLNSKTQERKERPAISRSFMLIAGLSIENALKSYIVAINPLVVNTGILDKKLQNHDLCKLKDLCSGLMFSENEIELLQILSDAIPYWGRYPVPKHFEQIKLEKLSAKKFMKYIKPFLKKSLIRP